MAEEPQHDQDGDTGGGDGHGQARQHTFSVVERSREAGNSRPSLIQSAALRGKEKMRAHEPAEPRPEEGRPGPPRDPAPAGPRLRLAKPPGRRWTPILLAILAPLLIVGSLAAWLLSADSGSRPVALPPIEDSAELPRAAEQDQAALPADGPADGPVDAPALPGDAASPPPPDEEAAREIETLAATARELEERLAAGRANLARLAELEAEREASLGELEQRISEARGLLGELESDPGAPARDGAEATAGLDAGTGARTETGADEGAVPALVEDGPPPFPFPAPRPTPD
jgi:hypothetical protein